MEIAPKLVVIIDYYDSDASISTAVLVTIPAQVDYNSGKLITYIN